MTGMAGNNLAQMFTGLQHHKQGLEQALRWAERANRIGWMNAGIDVAKIDQEAKDQLEDMDSSINLSGDTHIHVAPNGGQQQAQQPQPQQPATTPAPQPPATKPNGMPTWAKWALGAAIAASGLGPLGTAYFLTRPTEQSGGSVFAFDTELPPGWEQQPNDTP